MAGCSPSLESVVEDHRQSTGLEYHDCGTIVRAGAISCATTLSEAEKCMLEASGKCRPAEAYVDGHTVEGAPLPAYWFVEPSCAINVFTDHSEDPYKGDYGDITQSVCGQLKFYNAPDCGQVFPESCTTVEQW